MSVQKFNSKSKVSNQVIPYTQVNTSVIQKISNLEAGFVWIYLLSKPADWEIIKEHVKKHYGIGDKKIKTIFSYLKKHNLIDYIQVRTPDGKKISHYDICVLNGEEFIEKPGEKGNLSPGSLINPARSCASRKAGTTKNRDLQSKEKDKKEREATQKKASPPPLSAFELNERNKKLLRETAQRSGRTENDLVIKFKALMKTKDVDQKYYQERLTMFLIDERPAFNNAEGFKNIQTTKSEATNNRYSNMPDFTQLRLEREAAEGRSFV
jgi:hypothetical protein